MAEKLIMNANLIRKADRYAPAKFAVEKVIEVCDTEFHRFIEKPMERNYYLPQYNELMGYYDNAYHGILFINKQNGDGFLVDSEGADYARYSQYIPNARDIVQRHEQSRVLDDLKAHMDRCIDMWIEQRAKDKDLCISLSEFIDDITLSEILGDYASDSLAKHPQIESCTVGNGFIEAKKHDIVEIKLYCPLQFMIETEDYGDNLYETDPDNYTSYVNEINRLIDDDLYIDEESKMRGLAAYFGDYHLDRKVNSIVPRVEARNGSLYGVAVVKSYGELNKAELSELTGYISGQFSDGWGEGFEQNPINLGEDKVCISFWNSDDYFLKPESEVFSEPKTEQTLGGLA